MAAKKTIHILETQEQEFRIAIALGISVENIIKKLDIRFYNYIL